MSTGMGRIRLTLSWPLNEPFRCQTLIFFVFFFMSKLPWLSCLLDQEYTCQLRACYSCSFAYIAYIHLFYRFMCQVTKSPRGLHMMVTRDSLSERNLQRVWHMLALEKGELPSCLVFVLSCTWSPHWRQEYLHCGLGDWVGELVSVHMFGVPCRECWVR